MHDDPLEHRHPDHPHDVDVAQVPRSPHTPGQTNTPSLNRPMAHMITLRFLTIVMIMLTMLFKGEAPDEGWQRLVAMHSQANGNDNNI